MRKKDAFFAPSLRKCCLDENWIDGNKELPLFFPFLVQDFSLWASGKFIDYLLKIKIMQRSSRADFSFVIAPLSSYLLIRARAVDLVSLRCHHRGRSGERRGILRSRFIFYACVFSPPCKRRAEECLLLRFLPCADRKKKKIHPRYIGSYSVQVVQEGKGTLKRFPFRHSKGEKSDDLKWR